MVTHSSTSRPVQCLCMAERTGCPIFTDLWSYVQAPCNFVNLRLTQHTLFPAHYTHEYQAQSFPRDLVGRYVQRSI